MGASSSSSSPEVGAETKLLSSTNRTDRYDLSLTIRRLLIFLSTITFDLISMQDIDRPYDLTTYELSDEELLEELPSELLDEDDLACVVVDCALILANFAVKPWTSTFKLSTSFLFCCHSWSTSSKLVGDVFLIPLIPALLAALRTALAAFSGACATKNE
jgi:hypothetical protein